MQKQRHMQKPYIYGIQILIKYNTVSLSQTKEGERDERGGGGGKTGGELHHIHEREIITIEGGKGSRVIKCTYINPN